jgi:hypothetical protein
MAPNSLWEHDVQEIRGLMRDLKDSLERHMEQEENLRPHVLELITLLERSKGVITFLKVVLYISIPVLGVIAWAKEHIK